MSSIPGKLKINRPDERRYTLLEPGHHLKLTYEDFNRTVILVADHGGLMKGRDPSQPTSSMPQYATGSPLYFRIKLDPGQFYVLPCNYEGYVINHS